jgi:hypothetical protein
VTTPADYGAWETESLARNRFAKKTQNRFRDHPMLRSGVNQNKIIQKGLPFVCERSGTVTVPGTGVPRDPAPPAAWPRWGCGGGGKRRRTNAMEDSDGKTDRYAAHHSVRGFAAR